MRCWLMSALGQKQTCAAQKVMSALPPIADMCGAKTNVRFVPKADIKASRGLSPISDKYSGTRQNDDDFGELAGLRIDVD